MNAIVICKPNKGIETKRQFHENTSSRITICLIKGGSL